jgi:putative two-component system response regulator
MTPPETHTARLLIVDDQEANVLVLERLLRRSGYTAIASTTDPRQACALVAGHQPDLVLLDLHMPYLDGFAVLEQLGGVNPPDAYLPILVLTADITPAAKQRALSLGAKDFLTKPFDATEVLLRIGNLLHTRALHLHLRRENGTLEEQVRARTQELEAAELETLERLARTAEYRDDDTGEHTRRVGDLAGALARAVGLPADEALLIARAAPLHDVGKIGIPDGILLKPGRLTDEERTHMQTHTSIGARLLAGSRFPLLRLAEEIALTHHERWDGSGYPCGLAEAAIPLAGRIVAVVDVFDALTHERPYKRAWGVDEALAELARHAGRQFDPQLVRIFLQMQRSVDHGGAA